MFFEIDLQSRKPSMTAKSAAASLVIPCRVVTMLASIVNVPRRSEKRSAVLQSDN